MRNRVLSICILALLMSCLLIVNVGSQGEAETVDLNIMLKSRFDEWIAWLTRRLSLNGTTSDIFDYSRIMQGHEINATLSFPSFLLALTYMFENTGDYFYLSKLRAFIDGAINNTLNHAVASEVGQIFFPIAYYFDGVDHDTGNIYPAILGYIATKLYLLTSDPQYKKVADRIAFESYDRLTVVKNDTDVAWSWAYYKNRDLANAMKGVNRQAFFAWFYALYGKNINSTFTPLVSRVVNWVWRSQLSDNSLAYDIGGSEANPWYAAFATWATLNAYLIDDSAFPMALRNKIENTVVWLDTKYQAQYEYQRLYFLVPALLAALKTGYFSSNVCALRAKSMLYIALRSMHFTEKGFIARLDGYSFGFRWHQLELAGLFTAFPLSDSTLDMTQFNPVTTYEHSTGNHKLDGWTGGIFAGFFKDGKDHYGSSILHSTGRSLCFTPAGWQPAPTFTSITNNTHYVEINSIYASYAVNYYVYPVGVFVGDVTGTTSAEIVLDDANWRIRAANGSEWQVDELVSGNVYNFGNRLLLYLDDAVPANIRSFFVESPTTSWRLAFQSSMWRLSFSQSQTNYRVIYAEAETFGHLINNAGVMFSVLESLADAHNKTQPVDFETSFSSYHSEITELEPEADWKATYESAQTSPVKLIGHNLPEKVSLAAWSCDSNFLTFSISAPLGTESITEVYVGNRGEPKSVSGATSWSYNNETKTITVNVLHSGTQEIRLYWPERNSPTTTLQLDGARGSKGWFTSDVIVSFVAVDDLSGVDWTEYSFDNHTWVDYTVPLIVSNEGMTTVYYRSADKDGNLETTQIEAIQIDQTSPSGSIKINNDSVYTTTFAVQLSLVANDSISGVDEMRLSRDNVTFTEWQAFTSSYPWVLPEGEGLKTVYTQFKDKSGLPSSIYEDTIILDTMEPTANAGNDQTINEDTLVAFDGSDSMDENGIAAYTWAFTDVTARTLTGEKPTYTFNVPDVYTITINATDAAGNWATDTITITVLDVTEPVANAGQDQTVNVGTTVNFDASASNDNVGIVSYEWDFGDGTTGLGKILYHTYEKSGEYVVSLTVIDAEGNLDAAHVIVEVLATGEPAFVDDVQLAIIGAAVAASLAATLIVASRRKKSAQKPTTHRKTSPEQ